MSFTLPEAEKMMISTLPGANTLGVQIIYMQAQLRNSASLQQPAVDLAIKDIKYTNNDSVFPNGHDSAEEEFLIGFKGKPFSIVTVHRIYHRAILGLENTGGGGGAILNVDGGIATSLYGGTPVIDGGGA